MRQGIDIREVETATKIRAKYLRALENEEFELLPGSTFARTFLRTYAEYLGLDAHLLVEEYRVQHEPRAESELQPFASPPPSGRARRPTRPPGRGVVAAGLVGILLAFLLVLGLTGEDEDGGGAQERRDAAGRQDRARGKSERRRRARRDPPAAAAAATPRAVTLRVEPAEETYLCVDAGPGRVLFEGTLSEPRTFRQNQRLRINLGRTSAELRVNGKRVPLQDGPDSVGFEFTREGRQPLPEADRPCV